MHVIKFPWPQLSDLWNGDEVGLVSWDYDECWVNACEACRTILDP